MNKKIILAFMALTAMTATAQDALNLDTYIGANLATEDLNGTARYVGMGGAMDALGADLSTMGTNPAGIGLFRKNQVAMSFGLNSQKDGKSFHDGSKTNASFDQIGIVLATRMGPTSYMNFGFNFHKSRNFDYVLSAANTAVNGSSLHRQTYVKMMRGDLDYENPMNPKSRLLHPYRESQLDMLNYAIIEQNWNPTTMTYDDLITPRGLDYTFDRAHTGYIGEYDFNISGNINNRVYLGLTVGIHDVHYKGYSEYEEHFETPTVTTAGNTYDIPYAKYSDDQEITGTGYDVKLGVMIRPIEESPFRFGLSVHTPIWYKLKASNATRIYDQIGPYGEPNTDDIEFRMNTPWKFGVSLGHTVGSNIALGAGYEYADYGACDMRVIDGRRYDWYNDVYYDDSSSDNVMKRHTERTLRGVSTLKVGAEFKPDKNVAVRLGYNYVSPMYQEDGVRDQTLQSPGVYYASTTHYINWKDTHRITAGVGFSFDKFRLDLAYQYNMRKGNFYPFMPDYSAAYIDDVTGQTVTLNNHCNAVEVKDNRHQIQCSLTYSF